MSPQTAMTVQLLLYTVATVTAIVAIVRAVKLQRLVHLRKVDLAWWRTDEARGLVRHAILPLWITPAALILGAIAPRLLGVWPG